MPVAHINFSHVMLWDLMIRESAHDSPRLRWLIRHHVRFLARPFEEILAAAQLEGWAKPLPREHTA